MHHADQDARGGTGTAHVLLAHGSRDPQWPAAIRAVAQRIRQLDPTARVRCAYLESAQPDLAAVIGDLLAQGARAIAVWPMFFGLGRHARADLPRLMAAARQQIAARHPGVTLTLQPAIAEHPMVLEAMARVVLHEGAQGGASGPHSSLPPAGEGAAIHSKPF